MYSQHLDSVSVSETFGQNASFTLEQPIGSMSISPSGRDVVLASKEGLHIIDLDSPYSPPRYLPHRTPWEVADVQWSPFAVRDYWVVSTSNQKALVWNLGAYGFRDAIEHVLHGHSRAITDINFSAHHPDVLATCAVDSFVHGWDLRVPSRPAFTFSDWFSGATQVKFNRLEDHVIASSHDRFLHIWDKRNGAYPARTIEAHGTKIYGVDWNRFEPTKIVTCSLDKTIKFWDTAHEHDYPEQVIDAGFPVWRARHTPFGWGLLAMPQRGNGDLHLYDRRHLDGKLPGGEAKPVTTFQGHKGQVKEFLWRSQGTVTEGIDYRDFQLVSWGTDRELRLHTVSEETVNAIGYEKGVSKSHRLAMTRKGARYRTFRDSISEPFTPFDMHSRTDSVPSHHQPFLGRTRPSTNVGMSKVAVAQFRGWLHGGKREKRTGMHGKGVLRQDTDPISWMKNVKIASWSSDSLADEITQVGNKFKKIEFEMVDVAQRKAVVSLQGPWGNEAAMIYVRVDFRFPKAYPRDAPATVVVQKNSSVERTVHHKLNTETQTIAETFAKRQRGCIEAVLRYLLHEQTMAQAISWLFGDSFGDTKPTQTNDMPEDLSSDSDEENLSTIADPSSSSANVRVPIAKACGALWANDGSLVCFFPQKSDEPASILRDFGLESVDHSQSSRLFEAFGRLRTNQPARKAPVGVHGTFDDTASDVSASTSHSSGSELSSPSSSEADDVVRDQFIRYGTTMTFGSRHRTHSADRSNPSLTMDGTKISELKQLNIVTIHRDLTVLLPAQKDLAQAYQVTGNGQKVCLHNAAVADQADRPDAAFAWQLAALILGEKVVSSARDHKSGMFGVATATRSGPTRPGWMLDGINTDLTKMVGAGTGLLSTINWGHSPLAPGYLIATLFSHFEKLADIQMLAMLSAIFTLHDRKMRITSSKRASFLAAGRRSTPHIALSVMGPDNTPSHRLSVSSPQPSVPLRGGHLSVPYNTSNSRRPTVQVEEDDTAASKLRAVGDGPRSAVDPSTKAISVSPESRRPTTSQPFSASKASLSALAQSYQHSPPSNQSSTAASSLKKLSPSTSFTTGGWSTSFWGGNTKSSANTGETVNDDSHRTTLRSSKSSVTLHDLRQDGRRGQDAIRGSHESTIKSGIDDLPPGAKTRRKKIKVRLYNQGQFDAGGHVRQPLLDPRLTSRFKGYRSAYAELLDVWRLLEPRIEVLCASDHLAGSDDAPSPPPVNQAGVGLDVVKCCIDCGSTLISTPANGSHIAWRCGSPSCVHGAQHVLCSQVCCICETKVAGLMVPCFACGHLTCYDCAQIWFSDAETDRHQFGDESANTTGPLSVNTDAACCPTGCGCACPGMTDVVITAPPSATQLPTEIASSAGGHGGGSSSSSFKRQESDNSLRTHHSKRSDTGPDTALGAMMALSSRSRAASSATKSLADAALASVEEVGPNTAAPSSLDELLPWANERFASLGRGYGGGLSRGLSSKSSDATIRRL